MAHTYYPWHLAVLKNIAVSLDLWRQQCRELFLCLSSSFVHPFVRGPIVHVWLTVKSNVTNAMHEPNVQNPLTGIWQTISASKVLCCRFPKFLIKAAWDWACASHWLHWRWVLFQCSRAHQEEEPPMFDRQLGALHLHVLMEVLDFSRFTFLGSFNSLVGIQAMI